MLEFITTSDLEGLTDELKIIAIEIRHAHDLCAGETLAAFNERTLYLAHAEYKRRKLQATRERKQP
jgi:hypothetical protein